MKTISSSLTFLYKYIFSIFWSSIFGFGSIMMLIQDQEYKWVFSLVWFFGSIFIFLTAGRIKKVEFDGENFLISNYLRSEEVHKSSVASISASISLTPELVWIEFNKDTFFGKKISFIPKQKRRLGGFNFHPIAKELRAACNLE